MKRFLSPFAAGLLVAASMPPWGWWPLAFLGIAWYGRIAQKRRDAHAFPTSFFFAVGWFLPPLAWMWFLTVPGYVVVVALFALLHGIAGLIAHQLGHTKRSYISALIVCHSLVETLRLSWPFGGVPLATLSISQASSPIAALSPYVGAIGLCVVVFWIALSPRTLRTIAIVVLLITATKTWDGTSETPQKVQIAFVQGGGPQGTHAIYTDPRIVFQRHLAATRNIQPSASRTAVIWPEDVIDINGNQKFINSPEFDSVLAESQRLNVPIVVGITEDESADAFTNAVLVVNPDGQVTSRYDKVRRVPFGEYMPGRNVFAALGISTQLLPRDADAGDTRASITVAGTKVATPISWEIFFGGRTNEGIADGAGYIINPTNGASYTGTLLQSEQIAASRLRAREQGRWVVQVSPTGFSAFIGPNGHVYDRTKVSETRSVDRTFAVRTGRTPYSRLGNGVYIGLLVAGFFLLARRRARAFPQGAS